MAGWAGDNIGVSWQYKWNISLIIYIYRLASHIKFEDQNTKVYQNKHKQPRHTEATGIFKIINMISYWLDNKFEEKKKIYSLDIKT